MPKSDPIALSRALALTSIARNDPTGWFETLYRAVEAGETELPWDRAVPNPLLVEWFDKQNLSGDGRPAAVVGFGNGRDAEFIASRGFATTAFEVSETAVSAARKRWPGSPVDYVKADLLALPKEWNQAFSLVLESLTIQSLPRDIRKSAIEAVRSLVAPGGTLLVIATAIADDAPVQEDPPWPLEESEVKSIAGDGLRLTSLEHFPIEGEPNLGRWRAVFER
jgi:uncharacterized protein (UPF0147 family)